MAAIFLAVVLLAVLLLGIGWFLRGNPTALARTARKALVIAGLVAGGLLLFFGFRFVPALLIELLPVLGLVVAGLVVRALTRRAPGPFSAPGSGQRTEARTAFLEAWIDHATGDVGGRVLAGRFAGRMLDDLDDPELLELHGECAGDADSRRVLEAYLDRRLGGDWRNRQQAKPPPPSRGDMSRGEALAVLGLAEGASDDAIKAAHRRLILRAHPDHGGTADLAARINRAKDVLLGG
ncbi:molecular chaperone DnaJ [Reyranella sp.]|uniref:molecular chaperone DnaJ n=1 Tax=Reyranella sp. TaxID=1929291 RepID=UPI003BACF737